MAQQKGVSRVPVLRARINHLELFQKKAKLSNECAQQTQLGEKDIGKRVSVAGEEAVLRYVGNVQSYEGTWCKVEFLSKDGKDYVNAIGDRDYYEYHDTQSLYVVPESKVRLIESNADETNSSGPYSTLFALENGDKTASGDSGSLNSYLVAHNLHLTLNLNESSDEYNKELRLFPKLSVEEHDESLGILTPEQMGHHNDLNSPNFVDNTVNDLSLGILDETLLSNCALRSLKSVELSLDMDAKTCTRSDQTPSPEDLPLDPTPILIADPKSSSSTSQNGAVNSNSANSNNNTNSNNSFVTSITSITSLDIGYQGDGEMSRPASRGADNSPLTRRPIPRVQPRRQDPMTDSDFYTESDADMHEEHPLRGDRRAQVIDGTLYGVDPQEAADIYVNNRENMDSSGIFTDIESNTRAEDLLNVDVVHKLDATDAFSPSESSTQTPTENSQNMVHAKSNDTIVSTTANINNNNNCISNKNTSNINNNNNKETLNNTIITSTPKTTRMVNQQKTDVVKKYKLPNRNQPSKIKTMLETKSSSPGGVTKTPIAKKTPGRWDAVMNKISKGSPSSMSPSNLKKDIKSKVTCGNSNSIAKSTDINKKISDQKSNVNKLRRVRTRNASNSTKTSLEESVNSSLSDVSGASPAKKIASSKKREIGVTQVLTPSKLSPRNPPTTNGDVKKISRTSISTPTTQTKPSIDKKSVKEKERRLKDCSRVTGKGGRVSPGTRPPQQQAINKTPPRTTEALAVLVHHLVYNLEAFQTPSLRKELDRFRVEIEQAKITCQQLEESLNAERNKSAHVIENEQARSRAEIVELTEQHRQTILQLNQQHAEMEDFLKDENMKLQKMHERELHNVKIELNKLQNTHEETLNILHEENCAIREEIDEKNAIIKNFTEIKLNFEKSKKEHEARELAYKEQLHIVNEENRNLKQDNERIYSERFEGNNSLQEIQSLRAVLELKQAEVAELRTCLAKATEKVEKLPSTLDKVQALTSRCEDLELQLKRRVDVEKQLREERNKMDELLKEEINQKKRYQQHNEELKYKLKQLKEVLNRVVEQKEATAFNRSYLSMSYNERHNVTRPRFDRAISLRDAPYSGNSYQSIGDDSDIDSRPSSPKVKGVVKKYDSVSYVLEMDDTPDTIANRIVRRSFRNAINTKNNKMSSSSASIPITSPPSSSSNKRPRMKANSSSSGGDSCDLRIEDWDANEMMHSSPTHKLDIDEHHDLEIELPTLPSEIGKKDELQLLPEPKHLASENITSESNSEDESSSTGNL